jgi:hypothetical protein
MKNKIFSYFLIITSFNLWAFEHIELPAVESPSLKQSSVKNDGPLKYALSTPSETLKQSGLSAQQVNWTRQADGLMAYTLKLTADYATSINVGMRDFFLPPSAELWVYNDDKSILRGPYSDRYNPRNGYFWVGDMPGDQIYLTFTVKSNEQKYLSFNIDQVSRGFYAYWKNPIGNSLKSGSCNVDVACPEGDNWRPEISSVGQYSFQIPGEGGYVCTGQLINNTAQNGQPYFLTASHCGYTDRSSNDQNSVAASVNIIWNYESQTCRTPGSGSSGTPINKGTFNQRQAGATLVAHNPLSDFALLLLNQTPQTSYDIQYTGWDRSDTAFDGAVAIHHPSGHAKRISFENDALKITGYLQNSGGGSTHLRVVDWDLGTTEGGSSGSGLWNENYHLVGQLHGGYASCGNNSSDWYGRFYHSWDKGSTPENRLKDWLDPLDSRQMTLDTTGRCEAPSVTINSPSTLKVGKTAEFSATVSGGSGDYSYQWDINGDGQINGHGATIKTQYHEAYVGNITLTVKDDSGCQSTDSRAVIVESPDLQVQGQPTLSQVCGNNDNNIDPGERWKALLTIKNVGDMTARDSYLMFKTALNYGNQTTDNDGNAFQSCDLQYIHINQSANLKPWVKQWANYNADDMGNAVIQLNTPFKHYGQTVNTLVASTNGYLSTNPNAEGVDYSNDCPWPATADYDSGGRIAPLHDDLQGSTFYHKYFADCPRESETDTDACDVFTWHGADIIDTYAQESTRFQAILYPETSQWVFQYPDNFVQTAYASIGMQNHNADDALLVGCNASNIIPAGQSVCLFNKNHNPATDQETFIELVTPVVATGNLTTNQSRQISVEFEVDSDAECGQNHSIDLLAAIYDEGFNPGQESVIQIPMATSGQCQTVSSCSVNDANSVQPKTGLWWNPGRTGHGTDIHVMNNNRLLYTRYSGDNNGDPVWYVADKDESGHNLFYNDIGRVNFPGGFTSGQRQNNLVGWSHTYFLDAEHALQYRQIDGRVFAEKFEYQHLDTQATINQHTGHYYTPNESGWGQSVVTEGRYRVVVSYLYDNQGNPYWTYASGLNDNSTLTAGHFKTFCDHCPWVEPDPEAVGELNLEFNGQTDGYINFYDIQYPANTQQPKVIWERNELPIVNRNQ